MRVKALIVAASDYSDQGLNNLPGVIDLKIVKDSLIDGLKLSADDIYTVGEDRYVFKNELLSNLDLIKAEKNDVIIFYFSGHGSGEDLILSDSNISMKELIEWFKGLDQTKILIFDTCYSGNAQINNEMDIDDGIEIQNTNTLIMASSRPTEKSGFHPRQEVSLFTWFLCKALTYSPLIKQGKKSIYDIIEYIKFLSKQWEKQNQLIQHPVFRSSLLGTIEFKVGEYVPYQKGTFSYTGDGFIICSVDPIHTVDIKRYAVKIILCGGKTEEEIATISQKVVKITRKLNIFPNKQSERHFKYNKDFAKIICCYFGYEQRDIDLNIWAYRSVWVDDDQDKNHWLKEEKTSRLINGILVTAQEYYVVIKSLVYSDISKDEFINKTKRLFNETIEKTREFITIYSEIENGTYDEEEGARLLSSQAKAIWNDYIRLGDMPVAFDDLQDWFEERFIISSISSEMASFYATDKYKSWNEDRRNYFIKRAINEFHKKIDTLSYLDP